MSHQIEGFFKFTYANIQKLKPESIENAVILVSENTECNSAFEKITGEKLYPAANMPVLRVLERGTALINPTEAFLTP